jgi:hypothetical protein
LIVDNLAAGVNDSEILAAYPQLKPEDIRAALTYAAEMTRERIIPIPLEKDASIIEAPCSKLQGIFHLRRSCYLF